MYEQPKNTKTFHNMRKEIVTWPDSQMITQYKGYLENACLITSEAGMDAYGPSAYVVDVGWWNACLRGENVGTPEDMDNEVFMIDWDFDPDTFDEETYEFP